MPDPEESLDGDFETQLQGLFQQAEQALESRAAARCPEKPTTPVAPKPEPAPAPVSEAPPAAAPQPEPPKPAYPSLPQMLRPIVLGLEAVTRATGENTTLLNKLDKAAEVTADAQKELPQIVSDLRSLLEQKSGVNQRMFDALHEELKGYKDGFLLESVHRPIIRDLLSLYDDLAEIHRQMEAAIAEQAAGKNSPPALLERLRTMEMNVEHNLEFIVEVLARLEVTPLPIGTGKLDKRTQRAVAVELAEDPDEDTMVVRSVKRGFLWKERIFRAEEVVMKKWKEGFLVALAPSSQ